MTVRCRSPVVLNREFGLTRQGYLWGGGGPLPIPPLGTGTHVVTRNRQNGQQTPVAGTQDVRSADQLLAGFAAPPDQAPATGASTRQTGIRKLLFRTTETWDEVYRAKPLGSGPDETKHGTLSSFPRSDRHQRIRNSCRVADFGKRVPNVEAPVLPSRVNPIDPDRLFPALHSGPTLGIHHWKGEKAWNGSSSIGTTQTFSMKHSAWPRKSRKALRPGTGSGSTLPTFSDWRMRIGR